MSLKSNRTRVVLCLSMLLAPLQAQSIRKAAFEAPQSYFDQRQFCDTGDIDGDGDLDLLLDIGSTAPGLSVAINSGMGQFLATTPIPNAQASWFRNARFADINGDGNLDVVSVDSASSAASRLRIDFGNGGGSFGGTQFLRIDNMSGKLLVGEINGDGLADALVETRVWPRLAVRWIMPTTGGGFQVGQPRNISANWLTRSVLKVADLDGDARSEVAYLETNAALHRVEILNPDSVGDLSPAGSVSFPVRFDGAHEAITVADSDGDGDLDISMVQPLNPYHPQSLQPSFELYTSLNDGSGTFATPILQLLNCPEGPSGSSTQCHFGDWDGDGDLDALLSVGDQPFGDNQYSGYSLFENLGAMNFEFRTTYSSGIPHNHGPGFSDLDGDGAADYLGFSEIIWSTQRFPTWAPSRASVHQGNYPQVADLDNDGDLDFASFEAGKYQANDGTGAFPNQLMTLGELPMLSAPNQWLLQVAQDLDADGDNDLLATKTQGIWGPHTTHHIRFDGLGVLTDMGPAFPSLTAAWQRTGIAVTRAFCFQDFDGDGLIDIADLHSLRLQDPTSQFRYVDPPAYLGGTPRGAADVDNDGDLDLLLEYEATWPALPSFALALGRYQLGQASFTLVPLAPLLSGNTLDPQLADIDNDGLVDLLFLESAGPNSSMTCRVIFDIGGSQSPTWTGMFPPYVGGYKLSVADADLDGIKDILALSMAGPKHVACLFRGQGAGTMFSSIESYSVHDFLPIVADLDGDGDPDLVGNRMVPNSRFTAQAAGVRRQYDPRIPGPALAHSIISSTSPLAIGNQGVIRLTNLPPASPGVLTIGNQESDIPNYLGLGIISLNAPWTDIVPFISPSAMGTNQSSSMEMSTLVPPSLGGLSYFFQAIVYQAGSLGAPGRYVASNGLQMTLGQ